jgi:hypothetical protein
MARLQARLLPILSVFSYVSYDGDDCGVFSPFDQASANVNESALDRACDEDHVDYHHLNERTPRWYPFCDVGTNPWRRCDDLIP